MSRLYYDRPPGTGTLASGQDENKERIEKIAKLIPTEIIAGYLPLIGLVELVEIVNLKPGLYVLIFIACWVVIPFYIHWQSEKDPNTGMRKPWKCHASLSTVAFLFWAYSVSGDILVPNYYDVALANILLGLFTIATGWIPLRT